MIFNDSLLLYFFFIYYNEHRIWFFVRLATCKWKKSPTMRVVCIAAFGVQGDRMFNLNNRFWILLFLVILSLCMEGCKTSPSLTKETSKKKTSGLTQVTEQTKKEKLEESSSTARLSARNRHNQSSGSPANSSSPTVHNASAPKKNVSTSSKSEQAVKQSSTGTQIGKTIVKQARQESGSPDPNSQASRMAEQVTSSVVAPAEKSSGTAKNATAKTFEDVGKECYGEALKRAFNNL